MLPKEIKEVIKKHEKTIYNDIPVDEILTDLKADGVITANEVTKILYHNGHKAKNFELIQILEKRGISDFFILCTTLKNQEINNARELGTLLEKEAKEALNSANAMEDTNVQGANSTNITRDAVLTNNSNQDELMDNFKIIAQKLSLDKIFRLGINLCLPYNEVEETIYKNRNSYQKTLKILLLWRDKAGTSANIKTIIKVLRSMDQNLIADQLKT